MNIPKPPDGLLPGSEAARRLGIPRQTVNRWCRKNPALALRVDGRWYLDLTTLHVFAAGRVEGKQPGPRLRYNPAPLAKDQQT